MLGHEKLDVYRLSIEYVALSYELAKHLSGADKYARDQLLRASQSVPQNIAEGNGKTSGKDRARYFDIARGSALECASIQDILEACGTITKKENERLKENIVRIVSMLTKLSDYSRTNYVREEECDYDCEHEND